MVTGERVTHVQTPSVDTIRLIQNEHSEAVLNESQLLYYSGRSAHLKYLNNIALHKYLKIHKVALGPSGSDELELIADELSQEYMPRFLDASASAYSEIALHDSMRTKEERLMLVDKAQRIWTDALKTESKIQSSEYSALFDEVEMQYRLALSLAFVPLMRAIVDGNVTDEVRSQVFSDTVAMGNLVSIEMHRYHEAGSRDEVRAFAGLCHEINALNVLQYLDDPRYIPFPSTARADSGYYHPEQTHDIMLLNQHWGTIKKVIPIEIKSRTSLRDRKRYKALMIRGRMHLATDGYDPTKTADAFYRVSRGEAEENDVTSLERVSGDIREMLRLYQQGITPDLLSMRSITRFYNSKNLAKQYPEVAQVN